MRNHRVVLTDAGPLIALARIGQLALLPNLFGRVCITRTVHDEVLPAALSFPETPALAHALSESWVEVVEPPEGTWKPVNGGLDAGEISTIHVALTWQGEGGRVLLIMDDRAGRLEAQLQGIPLLGTAGLLGLARTNKLIPGVAPLLEQLRQAGYFIAPAVVKVVLEAVDEA